MLWLRSRHLRRSPPKIGPKRQSKSFVGFDSQFINMTPLSTPPVGWDLLVCGRFQGTLYEGWAIWMASDSGMVTHYGAIPSGIDGYLTRLGELSIFAQATNRTGRSRHIEGCCSYVGGAISDFLYEYALRRYGDAPWR